MFSVYCFRRQGVEIPNFITKELKKEHPTWKLPDRRVTKFIKRIKAGTPISMQEEEMSQGGSFRNFINKSFASKKYKEAMKPKPIVEEPPKPKEAEEESLIPTVTTEEDVEKVNPYATDDNTGKQECGCWCN